MKNDSPLTISEYSIVYTLDIYLIVEFKYFIFISSILSLLI